MYNICIYIHIYIYIYIYTYIYIYIYIYIHICTFGWMNATLCPAAPSRMSPMSCYIWMSHVTYGWVIKWVMPRMDESCHVYGVMSRMNEACHVWILRVFRSSQSDVPCIISHMNESCAIRCSWERQHTATNCNTLQHTATHCNTLQPTATHCNTLQPTAIHCNTLQHTAAHCNALQRTATHWHEVCTWVTWGFHVSLTHVECVSHMWHIVVMCLSHVCDMSRCYVSQSRLWHVIDMSQRHIVVMCLSHVCDMSRCHVSQSCLWHDSLISVWYGSLKRLTRGVCV